MLATRAAFIASRQAASAAARRGLATSAIVKKDFVQDLYLKELKSYKPKEVSANAHVGQVKEFHTPSAPQAPVVPSSADLAKELEAYDREEPSTASAAPAAGEAAEEDGAPGQTADEYLSFVEHEAHAQSQPSAGHH